MSWHGEWKAIQESIGELVAVCNDFASALGVQNSGASATVKQVILPMAWDIGSRIDAFVNRYESQLPADVVRIGKSFYAEVTKEIGYENASATQKTATGIAHFGAKARKFRSDFNFLTADLEARVMRLTERAFVHLQRSIIADPEIRNKWTEAKKKHEPACEKLGAVHLLLHGIWSFKAHSAGERTDLVLGEPLRDDGLGRVSLTAEGLVLTEWKIADENNQQERYEAALRQAELYGQGSLSAIELKRYRYLVMVSDQSLDLPDDVEKDGVIYRSVNVAVNPGSPSVQSRKPKKNTPARE